MPRRLFSLPLILLIAIAAYAPGLKGPWLFDDLSNIVTNETLGSDFSKAESWREAALSMPSGPLGRPVSALSYAVQSAVVGDPVSPFASKLVNLALHVCCAVLVFLLTRTLLVWHSGASRDALLGALLATSLWTLSALHLSTVLYAVQRMAQLSCLFSLGGLLVYARCRLAWLRYEPGIDDYVACGLWLLLFTVLGALAKENGILLPWLVALLEMVWFRAKTFNGVNPLLRIAGWFGLFAPPLMAALWLAVDPSWLLGGFELRDFSLSERLGTQLRLLWAYLLWFLIPLPGVLGLFHDNFAWSAGILNSPVTLIAAGSWLAVFVFALRFAAIFPALLLALGWWWIGHSLESTLLPLEMVFEHRNYLPSVGVAICAGIAVQRLMDRVQESSARWIPYLLVIALAVPLCMRAFLWSDASRLAESLCERHPQSVRSCHFYAQTQLQRAMQSSGSHSNANSNPKLDASDGEGMSSADRATLARFALLKLHEQKPNELVTNAAMFMLDSHSIPNSPAVASLWVPRILSSLQGNRLDVTEVKALAQILACAQQGPCIASREEQAVMEAALLEGSANFNAGVAELIEQYRAAATDPAELILKIRQWSAGRPASLQLTDWTASLYLENRDLPSFFEELVTLTELDRKRLRYPELARAISRSLNIE